MSRFRHIAAGLTAGVAAVLALLFASAAPASAHDELASSSPAAGEALATAPDAIALQFTDDVLALGAVVVVADASGRDWAAGPPDIRGTDLTAALTAGMPAGTYEVQWRVVSSDGHPISGAIPFTVAAGPSPEVAPSATPTPAPPPTQTPTSTATASPTATSAPAAAGDGFALPVLLLVAGTALVALVVVVLLFLLRRSRRAR